MAPGVLQLLEDASTAPVTCRVCSQPAAPIPSEWEPKPGHSHGRGNAGWSRSTGAAEAPEAVLQPRALPAAHTEMCVSTEEPPARGPWGWGCWAEQEQLWRYLRQLLPAVPTKALHHRSPGVVTTHYSLHQPLQATLQSIIARGGQKTKFSFFCHFQNLFANITFLFYLFRENYTILHSTV